MTDPNLSSENPLERTIDCFWETIPPTWNQVRAHIRAQAADHFGVTFEQFHVLRHVGNGRCTISELATVKRISRSAISQAVDILVKKDMLTRTEGTIDRRFVRLGLTTSGQALLDAVFSETNEWMCQRMFGLCEEELSQLRQGMQILQSIFSDKP
jgi:DNA-binding MarR family transcriptional regulator